MADPLLDQLIAAISGPTTQVPLAPAEAAPAAPVDPREAILAELANLAGPEALPVPPTPNTRQNVFASIADALGAFGGTRRPLAQAGLQRQREQSQAVERANVAAQNQFAQQTALADIQGRLGIAGEEVAAGRRQEEIEQRQEFERGQADEARRFDDDTLDKQFRFQALENEKNRRAQIASRRQAGNAKAEEHADTARATGSGFLEAFIFGDEANGIPSIEQANEAGTTTRTRRRLELLLDGVPNMLPADKRFILRQYDMEVRMLNLPSVEDVMAARDAPPEGQVGEGVGRSRFLPEGQARIPTLP